MHASLRDSVQEAITFSVGVFLRHGPKSNLRLQSRLVSLAAGRTVFGERPCGLPGHGCCEAPLDSPQQLTWWYDWEAESFALDEDRRCWFSATNGGDGAFRTRGELPCSRASRCPVVNNRLSSRRTHHVFLRGAPPRV